MYAHTHTRARSRVQGTQYKNRRTLVTCILLCSGFAAYFVRRSQCVSRYEESGLCLEKESSIFISIYADTNLVVGKLTHCGRVTQICIYTLQLCKTDDANLRF